MLDGRWRLSRYGVEHVALQAEREAGIASTVDPAAVGARDAASQLARLLPIVYVGCPHGIVHTGKHCHGYVVLRHSREHECEVAIDATHYIVEVDGCVESHEYCLKGAVGLEERQKLLALDIGKE